METKEFLSRVFQKTWSDIRYHYPAFLATEGLVVVAVYYFLNYDGFPGKELLIAVVMPPLGYLVVNALAESLPMIWKPAFAAVLSLAALVVIGIIPIRTNAYYWSVIHESDHMQSSQARNEALEVLVRRGVPLDGLNMSFKSLRSSNLAGADLTRAVLKGTDLAKANLSGANLSFATVSNRGSPRTNLACADLSNANLTNADLALADLRVTDLRGAIITGARMSPRLQHANIKGVVGQPNGFPREDRMSFRDLAISQGAVELDDEEWEKYKEHNVDPDRCEWSYLYMQ